jgi:hypothetical protein
MDEDLETLEVLVQVGDPLEAAADQKTCTG